MNTDTSKSKEPSQEDTEDRDEVNSQQAGREDNDGASDRAPVGPTEDLQNKLQESEKKYLYLYSEFENFRRRNERDRIDFLKFGHEGFLRELLQVMDNFERALEHAKGLNSEKGSSLSQVAQGIEMIHFQMTDTLRNQGVTPIKAIGVKFDPTLHEAVGDEASDSEPGIILKEAQKGYTLHGRLLRPSRVIVAKKKA